MKIIIFFLIIFFLKSQFFFIEEINKKFNNESFSLLNLKRMTKVIKINNLKNNMDYFNYSIIIGILSVYVKNLDINVRLYSYKNLLIKDKNFYSKKFFENFIDFKLINESKKTEENFLECIDNFKNFFKNDIVLNKNDELILINSKLTKEFFFYVLKNKETILLNTIKLKVMQCNVLFEKYFFNLFN